MRKQEMSDRYAGTKCSLTLKLLNWDRTLISAC